MMFHRIRSTLAIAFAFVLVTAGVAAAWTGQDGWRDFDEVNGYTYAYDNGSDKDYSYSRTTRDDEVTNTGVKNVYQEYFLWHWDNVSTASDMYSGASAWASQWSPTPSTCRNGRFVGDHYAGGTKKGTTTVNPPSDNCP